MIESLLAGAVKWKPYSVELKGLLWHTWDEIDDKNLYAIIFGKCFEEVLQ